jgi:hypothetical protein
VVRTSGIIIRHSSDKGGHIKSPQGFGESVNKYLNHFVNVADAKAAGLLTVDLAIGGALVSNIPVALWPQCLHWAALLLLATSGIFALWALYPRTPKIGSSLIFWDDIRARPTVDDYLTDLSQVDDMEIERQYGAQNYLVSGVLSIKYRFVRCSMWCLLATIPLLAIRLVGV